MFKLCGAEITQAYNKHTGTWGGFEISSTEYVNFDHHFAITSTPRQEIPNHTSRAFSTSSLEWSVALVGYAMFATTAGTSVVVDWTNTSSHTVYEVNKLARKATAWARTPLKINAHHSPVVVAYTDGGWTT